MICSMAFSRRSIRVASTETSCEFIVLERRLEVEEEEDEENDVDVLWMSSGFQSEDALFCIKFLSFMPKEPQS